MKVGIDAISFDVPKIYLPIADLAVARGIEPEKLKYGLGLERMSYPDVHQDAVVFAGNAIKKLIEQENLQAQEISRIYVATESGVDGSKPIASYLLPLLENTIFSTSDLSHVDVVDLTFACVAGVDALQNCIDFVRVNPTQKAIVICTDIAKYDLNSTGEYTQGAGAIAMLVSANPKLIAFENNWAVSTEGVFDFFKPRRTFTKKQLGVENNDDWNNILETEVEIFKEQPVFEGQYSNQCYLNRTSEAYFRLKKLKNTEDSLYTQWNTICMHLPYCFQARRIFTEIFIQDSSLREKMAEAEDIKAFKKEVSKSEEYKKLVQEKILPTEIASGKIGNMYTASIFMGMLSALSHHAQENTKIEGETFGFIAYGSGSKSKAFEGIIQPEWKSQIEKCDLFATLEECKAISIEEYTQLHKKEIETSVIAPHKEFMLASIEKETPYLLGARYYKWI